MSTLIGLICLLFLRATQVDSQSLCDASTYLEVKEGRDNTFVCTGLTPQQNVYWYWRSQLVSTCNTTSCSNDIFPQNFQFSIMTATSSDIAVYVTAFPSLDYLATTNLSCQQTSPNTRVTCQLDVVYPVENPMCQIQFIGDTWEVTGWCNVSKALSRRNRYGCYVYQTSPQPTSLVGNFTMSTKPIIGTNYSSGDCQIKIALPPEGKYNYSVTIIPGEVPVVPSFNGSNEIRRPSESPQQNCSQYVTEGDDVDCLCYSNNLGLPPGSLLWEGTSSSRLKIDKVNRTYSGTSNTCILMWNNTAVQSTQYTVTVNYAPRVLSFKIDNKADVVNVTENTNVSVVCQAEGRPLPTISLYRKGSDNLNHNISVANNVSELKDTINVVNCEAEDSYFCKSANSISVDQRNILLIVLCSPKKTTNDSYFTTFVNGEASLTFKMNAYPPPNLLSIVYNGSANNSISQKVEHENTLSSTCSSDTWYSYMITCTVTLLNETIYATGFYTITFSNSLGGISFAFEVKEKQQTTTTTPMKIATSPGPVPGPIVGGVIGGVVFIALIVAIIIFIVRRKGKSQKAPSLPNNTVEEDFSEHQNNRAETPKEVYAIVDKKDPKPTTASRMTDVYADVKKGSERTEVDSTAFTLSPAPDDATKDKKGKISKTHGKGKKKGKGDKKPLAAKNTGIGSGAGALSMSPMTESEYENCGFDENEQENERKGAKEIQRRNQQGLNYTTVVFDNTRSNPTPPPVLESTEYAEIVPRQKPRD